MLTTKELRFFSMARDQAKTSQAGGGIPIGSVLVSGDRGLGVGHNRRLQDSDPTSHSEIQCLRNAQLRPIYHDTVLYSTGPALSLGAAGGLQVSRGTLEAPGVCA